MELKSKWLNILDMYKIIWPLNSLKWRECCYKCPFVKWPIADFGKQFLNNVGNCKGF